MMTQPAAYAGVAQTHGPTVAGAMQDVEMDEMPEHPAALYIVRREGEPSQGFMNEGALEDEAAGTCVRVRRRLHLQRMLADVHAACACRCAPLPVLLRIT
jgi:hypothetical protein